MIDRVLELSGTGPSSKLTGWHLPLVQAARPRVVQVRASAAKRETDPKKRIVITGMWVPCT